MKIVVIQTPEVVAKAQVPVKAERFLSEKSMVKRRWNRVLRMVAVSILTIAICLTAPNSLLATELVDEPIATESPGFSDEVETPVLQQSPYVDGICFTEKGADKSNASIVNKRLLAVPRWLRQAFVEDGWRIGVVSYDIAMKDYGETHEEGTVLGSTAYGEKMIKILNTSRAATYSPVHEFGHWLDAFVGFPTLNSKIFNKVWEEEGETYFQSYGPQCEWNIHEFFAEGFCIYWSSPVSLQKNCPQFYNFLKEVLERAEVKYLENAYE